MGKKNNNRIFPREQRVGYSPTNNVNDSRYIDHVNQTQECDLDTKILLRDIQEQGISAVANDLLPAFPEESDTYTRRRSSANTSKYDGIRWESQEVKELEMRNRYCKCGKRIKVNRIRKGYKTCSKECQDIWFKNELSNNT